MLIAVSPAIWAWRSPPCPHNAPRRRICRASLSAHLFLSHLIGALCTGSWPLVRAGSQARACRGGVRGRRVREGEAADPVHVPRQAAAAHEVAARRGNQQRDRRIDASQGQQQPAEGVPSYGWRDARLSVWICVTC